MPKNDNVKPIRLYESVKANIGEETADKMAETVYLSSSADFKRKFKWANDVCTYLESNFDESQVKQIRMGCSCTPPPKLIERLRGLLGKSELDTFAREYETSGGGSFTLACDGDALIFTYPRCYCDCVQRISEPVSKTWCLCTVGYTKKLFDAVFGCDTEVELLESIKSGAKQCVMRIIKK